MAEFSSYPHQNTSDFVSKKKSTGFHPNENVVDGIVYSQREKFLRDQRKVALLAAGLIENRDELCTVLEMLGLDVVPAE